MQEELERKEQQKLSQLNQRKRKMILEERRREEEMRVHELMARQESGNEALAQVMDQQRRMHLLKRERINLSQEQKRLNVERQKRIAEYKRLQTLRKIKADEEKVRNIEREKARMLQKRKAAAIQVKVQRDQIAKGLEALRLTKQWDKAGALLTNITAKKSTGKKKKKKKKKG